MESAPNTSSPVPAITLLGPGFLSRMNLTMGWTLVWRVALANAAISALLHWALVLARNDSIVDLFDRLLLFATTTVAGLLVTDWAGRRVARARYRLTIERFVGVAIVWREMVASLAWGLVLGATAAGGLGLVQAKGPEVMRSALTIAWMALLLPLAAVMALAGVGWAAHRVFWMESQKQHGLSDQADGLRAELGDNYSGELQSAH